MKQHEPISDKSRQISQAVSQIENLLRQSMPEDFKLNDEENVQSPEEVAPDDAEEMEKLAIKVPSETIDRLETIRFLAARTLPSHKRHKLTKSIFYSIALEIIAESYKSERQQSELWLNIFKWAQEDGTI